MAVFLSLSLFLSFTPPFYVQTLHRRIQQQYGAASAPVVAQPSPAPSVHMLPGLYPQAAQPQFLAQVPPRAMFASNSVPAGYYSVAHAASAGPGPRQVSSRN